MVNSNIRKHFKTPSVFGCLTSQPASLHVGDHLCESVDQSIDGGCLEVDLLLEPPRDEAAPLQHVVGSEHQEVGPVRGVRQGRPQVRGQGGGDDQVILPPRVAARCPQLARSGAGPQVVADRLLGFGVLNDHLPVPYLASPWKMIGHPLRGEGWWVD